jgi:photosystem II stability/assembly factor-like uncharacterized protein
METARYVCLFLGALELGCTFYTDCPDGTSGTQCAAAGGNAGNGTGGSATAGTGGLAGQPPSGSWTNATSNLATGPGCGVHVVSSRPDEEAVIAGVAGGGLWASRDGGSSWEPLGTGEGSAAIENRPVTLVYDPEDSNSFWEAGSYSWGVFSTHDGGDTFEQLGMVYHVDNVSIDFTDPARSTMLAGAHEQGHTVFRSTDGGANWTDIGSGLPSDRNACSFPMVLDADTVLIGCSRWGDGNGGILRSEDGGDSWSVASEMSAFSEALLTSDGSIYWGGESSELKRSDDQGETWEQVAGSIEDRIRPIELPDGRIATLTTEFVIVTADRGETWRPVTSRLPASYPGGLAYSASQKAFFVWFPGCDDSVRPDAVARYDFDYEVD